MWSNVKNHGTLLSNVEQYQKTWHIAQQCGAISENMAHCLAMWSILLSNNIALVKDSKIRVEHSIEISLLEETPAITLRKKLMKLQFWKAMDKTITTEFLSIIQRTPQQYLQITHLQIPSSTTALSTKLWVCYLLRQLRTSVNTKLVKETFYHELIQNTSLPTNYNFASIITGINKKIEHHTQQKYPITYASKGKGKLQTLAFIRGLCSSILQQVRPIHPVDFLIAITHTRDFKAAKLEANHAQAVNLVMNGSSDLDSKLKQFSEFINQKLKGYLADNRPIYQPSQRRNNQRNANLNKVTLEPIAMLIVIYDQEINIEILITATHNISTAAINSLSTTTINLNTTTKLSYDNIQKPQIQSNLKLEIRDSGSPTNSQFNKLTIRITPANLLVTPEDAASSKQKTNQKPLTCNILPAANTKNESLAAIFLFELEKITLVSLFSGVALDTKPITAMYTDAKIITANGTTKTPIGKIDDFLFEVNGIIVSIKVLVIKATQYQALVGNNWLIKTNVILDWTTQELQLSQNGQYTRVSATCSHFKTINTPVLLIKFEEEEKKLIWEAYQNSKRKRKVKEEELLLTDNYIPHKYTPPQPVNYCRPKLICVDCDKKLSSIGICYVEKWDNIPCLACEKTLLDEGMWNDIPGHEETCDKTCQYTILINDWVYKETLINDRMASAKTKGATISELLEIKNNSLSLPEPEYVQIFDNVEDDFEEFHKHYQRLAPTREEQEQQLAQLNT
ncbi:hypothetical protein G9A89_008155 [Geosiphon pyriformis]|nr:hypothetical protein G9A89_008155 [Geosiphon pyriformis]